jgi:hypothetical protein
VNRNAIVKVEQLVSRAWINKIVLTEKANKKVRLCLDPSDLNKCVVRQPHMMPTITDFSEKLAGKKILYFNGYE